MVMWLINIWNIIVDEVVNKFFLFEYVWNWEGWNGVSVKEM